jgi:hypothetical protein
LLDLLLAFFGDGETWARRTLNDGRGGRCLDGALQYIEREGRVSANPAAAYLRDAISHPAPALETFILSGLRFVPDADMFPIFNDTCPTFAVLRAVIADARARAEADLSCHASREAIAA